MNVRDAKYATWLTRVLVLLALSALMLGTALKRGPRPHATSAPVTQFTGVRIIRAPGWSALFHRRRGWTGADGIYSHLLSRHEFSSKSPLTLFTFNDTFYGTVDREGKRSRSHMVTSSAILTSATRPLANTLRFYYGDGIIERLEMEPSPTRKTALFPLRGAHPTSRWLWPLDSIVTPKALLTFAMEVRRTADPGPFPFTTEGLRLCTTPLDNGMPRFTDTRCSPTTLFHKNRHRTLFFGAAVLRQHPTPSSPADEWHYIYGRFETPSPNAALARVRVGQTSRFKDWQYRDGHNWSRTLSESATLGPAAPEYSVTYMTRGPFRGKYLMLLMTGGKTLTLRLANTPEGPFGRPVAIYHMRSLSPFKHAYGYNAKAHPHLSRPDALLISCNVNSASFEEVLHHADLYRPRFFWLTWEPQP